MPVKIECHRCGKCCRSFLATIPKYDTSDLSPAYLKDLCEKHGVEYMMDYINKNSEHQGKRCKWLKDESYGTTSCLAYDRRSSECIDFPQYKVTTKCLTRVHY